MLKRMVNALRGSVRLEVSGAFPERFLNLCAQRGIVFWNVEWLEATRLRLTVTRQGSGPARALGDKVLCTVVPAEQSGVPFFLGRFRRRYALLVGLALSQWDSLKQLRGRRGQEAASEKDLEAKNAE